MTQLEIRHLDAGFGAEVTGFDPRALDDHEVRSALQAAFDERYLLRFRDIDLTHPEQVRLSRMLIREESADDPDAPMPADSFYISNRKEDSAAPFGRLQFHSDTMWADDPFQVLSLYGVEVELPTAPTTFVSAVEAWETLPADLRSRVEGLHALHTAGEVRRGDLTDVLVSNVQRPPTTIAPIGRPHPRTGDTVLYICEQMTKEIVELPRDEGEALLEALFVHLYDPERTWEQDWRAHDFVVWDNIAMQHARQNVEVEGPARTLRKVASPVPKLSPDQMPSFSAPK
ncbi:MAG TPA: TauD/TfdA family dioxygenase [Acidimicrobiales bacterium]